MFKKTIYLFVLCFGMYVNTQAQSIKQLLKQGSVAMSIKDYSSATQIYNQIILIDSSNVS